MHIDHFHHAELDSNSLKDIQQLEQQLDIVLVAMEPDPEPAKLDSSQLQLIQALEKKTGKVLVAYEHQ